jgi:hypothetical protein
MAGIVNVPTGETCETPIVLVGKTQSGKSGAKAVVQAVCFEVSCPLIIVTKGVSEARALLAKLKRFARDSGIKGLEKKVISTVFEKGQKRWNSREGDVTHTLCEGGTLVVADTASQMKKAIQAVEWIRAGKPRRKFVLIVDEADAMYRTPEKTQQFEMQYERLTELGPCLSILITATPVPVLIVLKEIEKRDAQMITIEPDKDYLGVEDMQPMQDTDGNDIFLESGGLRLRSEYEFDQKATTSAALGYTDLPELPPDGDYKYSDKWTLPSGNHIPYTDNINMSAYEKAFSSDNKRGLLVLDVTNPRVHADGNIFEKATVRESTIFEIHFLVREQQY